MIKYCLAFLLTIILSMAACTAVPTEQEVTEPASTAVAPTGITEPAATEVPVMTEPQTGDLDTFIAQLPTAVTPTTLPTSTIPTAITLLTATAVLMRLIYVVSSG